MRLRLHLEIISRVSALVFAVVLGATGTPVLSQCEVQRLTTDDTVPPWTLNYGTAVAIGDDLAAVTATYGDFEGTVRTGFAYTYGLANVVGSRKKDPLRPMTRLLIDSVSRRPLAETASSWALEELLPAEARTSFTARTPAGLKKRNSCNGMTILRSICSVNPSRSAGMWP